MGSATIFFWSRSARLRSSSRVLGSRNRYALEVAPNCRNKSTQALNFCVTKLSGTTRAMQGVAVECADLQSSCIAADLRWSLPNHIAERGICAGGPCRNRGGTAALRFRLQVPNVNKKYRTALTITGIVTSADAPTQRGSLCMPRKKVITAFRLAPSKYEMSCATRHIYEFALMAHCEF